MGFFLFQYLVTLVRSLNNVFIPGRVTYGNCRIQPRFSTLQALDTLTILAGRRRRNEADLELHREVLVGEGSAQLSGRDLA